MLKRSSIQASVLDRLRNMRGLNILGPFQVCNGPADLEDPVVGPGAQAELGDGQLQELLPFPAHFTKAPELPCPHLGVGMYFTFREPLRLQASRRIDSFTNSI